MDGSEEIDTLKLLLYKRLELSFCSEKLKSGLSLSDSPNNVYRSDIFFDHRNPLRLNKEKCIQHTIPKSIVNLINTED